ncbi:MAG: tetratricopeptide repeat protein [Terriglobia bacterium]
MLKQTFRISKLPLWVFLLVPCTLWSQVIPHPEIMGSELRKVEKRTWNVFGKVTDLKGAPLRAAAVRVDIGQGSTSVRVLTSNPQGEFRTEYTLDASTNTSLAVKLAIEREGYVPAHEYIDFGVGDKTWEIDIAMQPDTLSDDQLPVRSLVNKLAPTLRAELESDATIGSARKDFRRGASDFLDSNDAPKAVPSLMNVVKRYPACGHCRTLLGLALLDAGSWNGASREFAEAANLALTKGSNADKVNSFLTAAEMENWKDEYGKAAGFLMQARAIDPTNTFILQELGRTLILQENWEAAENYLSQALAAGASKEATLLRAKALLEEGEPEAADAAMKEYVGDTGLRNLPAPARKLAAQIDERLKLRAYGKVQSVVSQPLTSLIEAVPELAGIEPASSQADLPDILHRAGENVSAFFQNFQNTTSTEQILEERLSKDGKIRGSLDQKFRYLLLTRPLAQGLGLQEFRTDLQGNQSAPSGLDSGLMLTSGFASASLLFHPSYQPGATFRYLGRQTIKGHPCHVVAFAQKPETARMVERFDTNDASVLLLFQGLAWIDQESSKIIRLRTDLLKPQSKIRLQQQTTEITYNPVQFKQVGSVAWLPSEVAVTVEWAGKKYHNVHRYSDFKLFNTQTKDKISVPVSEPPQ